MTTPDSSGAKTETAGGAQAGPARVTRPVPGRIDPIRSGAGLAQAAAPPSGVDGVTGPAPPSRDAGEAVIGDAVAEAVKSGYDVLEETIAQGRAAAEKFRQGEYNFRQVPGDIETLAMRLLVLARQLSTTTFDICEQLLHQIGSAGGPPPPGQAAAGVPPFLASVARGATAQPTPPAAPASAPAGMRLAMRFAGTDKAIARCDMLARPAQPTTPGDISVTPLAPREGGGAALTQVAFEADLAGGGLIATVTVPAGQPAGVYSGLVLVAGQAVPLGMFVVELAG